MHLIAGDRQGARANGLTPAIEQRMTGASAMPELKHDATTGAMHGVSGEAPALDLGLVVDPWFVPEGGVAFDHHRGFGHDQPCTGALAVVLRHQRTGHMLAFGAAAREWCHPDAIGQLQGSQAQRGEQIGHPSILASCSSSARG